MSAPVLVTMVAKVRDVRMGDLVDHHEGLLQVREIVQRQRGGWDLAGDPPGPYPPRAAPTLRRALYGPDTRIRVRRDIEAMSPIRGHGSRVHTHAPTSRGWYTDPGGWDAACACGWSEPTVHADKCFAEVAWEAHKAAVLTSAACAELRSLQVLTELDETELPPVPWEFWGSHEVKADLIALPAEQAREVISAWAAVLGADDVGDETVTSSPRMPHGGRRLWMWAEIDTARLYIGASYPTQVQAVWADE